MAGIKPSISLIFFIFLLSLLKVETGWAGTAYWPIFLPAIIGNNGEHPDCNGEPGGTAVIDECGVCGGDGTTCSRDNFERSSSGHTVTDNITNLMWQDYSLRFKNEADGISYCEQLSLDNYTDWRLPILSEIQDFFRRVYADPNFDLNHWGTFSGCTANVAIGGYVKTIVGAEKYGGSPGDTINFSGGAAARCVR